MSNQPVPPAEWDAAPSHIENGAAFSALSKSIQVYVAEHWFWSKKNTSIWGRGLVPHYNWLKMQFEELEISERICCKDSEPDIE